MRCTTPQPKTPLCSSSEAPLQLLAVPADSRLRCFGAKVIFLVLAQLGRSLKAALTFRFDGEAFRLLPVGWQQMGFRIPSVFQYWVH